MDSNTLLVDRLEALRARLNVADAAVGSASSLAPTIANRCRELDAEIPQARASAGIWQSLATWEKADEALFRDVLAQLRAAGRAQLPDFGPTSLARGLIAELSTTLALGAPPKIMPDVDDSFSDSAEIIRLRYPPAGIWDVPIVAHELGHFVAYRSTSWEDGLQRSQDVPAFISDYLAENPGPQSESEQEKWRFWLNELFADAFATYCAGPCYAASALLLRFDVAQACSSDDRRHPSYAARAVAILAILGEMNGEKHGPYARVIQVLTSKWRDLLTFAEQGDCKGEWVAPMAYKLYSLVRKVARSARYDNWSYADDTLKYMLMNPSKTSKQRFSARDLLNAAWLARAHGGNPAAISACALQLWEGRAAAASEGGP